MNEFVLHHVKAMRPGVGIVGDCVTVRQGKVIRIETLGDRSLVDCSMPTIDGDGRLLTPGLIEIHIHGIERYLFESSPEAMGEGLAVLPKYGVTTVLPTLYRVMDRPSLPKLEVLAAAMAQSETVNVPGFHLEGPFLALPGAGAETVPGDVALLDDLLAATGNRVWAMSVSPDTPRIMPVAKRLRERNVVGFLTHTAGTVEQTRELLDAGISHATHFYDVYPVPAERDPGVRQCGVVETVLADPRVSVDFICDGVHVEPIAIEMALQCKGVEGVLAITDANIGAGLTDGQYDSPWGMTVRVREGDACRIHAPGEPKDGVLAGSALTSNKAVSNLRRWLSVAEHDVWAMASRSVAGRMGLEGKGDLIPGSDADLVLWDDHAGELSASRTWVGGRLVYNCSMTTTGSPVTS